MVLDRQVTEVLCAASVQHLHLKLETLPVGLIVVDQNNSIVSVDEWSQQLLECDKGSSITAIFGDVAKSWIQSTNTRENRYLGGFHFLTRAGVRLNMEIALVPSITPHQNNLHIVFSLDS